MNSGVRLINAETVRREVQDLLRTIAGSGGPRDTVKAAINRTVEQLAHPELDAGVVKRLWYGEQSVSPAHLVDHIRRRATIFRGSGFALEPKGRIVSIGSRGPMTAVVVR